MSGCVGCLPAAAPPLRGASKGHTAVPHKDAAYNVLQVNLQSVVAMQTPSHKGANATVSTVYLPAVVRLSDGLRTD